jgi:beta-lactam-binding protein with PASTA domain
VGNSFIPRDWVFPIVLAIFVGVVVWFGRTVHDFLLPPANTVTLPSFVGQALRDVNTEIQRLHLSSTVVERTTSDRYPRGVVISQQPEANAQVRQGRNISFIVSNGIIAQLMPDLRYQSMREVTLDLSRVRMQTGTITYVKSDIVPDGHVIDQDPAPLSNISEGDKVNLTVSKGGTTSVRVPNFTGMSIDDARAAASKAGIQLGQIVWTPLGDSPPHGVVARQFPSAGEKINSYSPVSLQVSAGPNESGYILRQVHLLVSVPVIESQDADSAGSSASNSSDSSTSAADAQLKVRLAVTDATGQYDLYNAYAQPGQKLDFTVSALGTSVVDMYVNDVLVGETRLGDEPPKVYGPKGSPEPSKGKKP